MTEKQHTLQREVTISGKGLHSGKEVTAVFKPAKENTGYIFKRTDIDNEPEIPALAEYVTTTARGTTLECNGAGIMTIEHSMAALYSLGVDNMVCDIDGPEMPILDGSSLPFIKAFGEVGTVEQAADRKFYCPEEKFVFQDDKGGEIVIYPDTDYSVDVHVDYNSKVVGNQYALLKDLKDFAAEIAPCKTFVFLHELEFLAKNNLIKGGDLDNALVIVERSMSQEELDKLADLLNKPHIEVLPEGYLSNTELSFHNEPARHKLLDVIGDLALTGVRLKGKIIANKPGHYINTEAAKVLRKKIAEN